MNGRLSIVIVVLSFSFGCGGPKSANLTPSANSETLKKMPDWYLSPPSGEESLYAAATMVSNDVQMAVQKARVQAQAMLSEQLGQKLGSMTKQFREEAGAADNSYMIESTTQVVKSVTKQTLVGAELAKKDIQEDKGAWRAYVLMSLPLGDANRALLEQIRANNRLHTDLKASKAFQELEKELENY